MTSLANFLIQVLLLVEHLCITISDDEDDGTEPIVKKSADKPLLLKDYQREYLLQTAGQAQDSDDDDAAPVVLTHEEEQRLLKENLLKAANNESDTDDNDSDIGGLLKKRSKTAEEQRQEDEEFKKFMIEEQKKHAGDADVMLKLLGDDESLPPEEQFLREYVAYYTNTTHIILMYNIAIYLTSDGLISQGHKRMSLN